MSNRFAMAEDWPVPQSQANLAVIRRVGVKQSAGSD